MRNQTTKRMICRIARPCSVFIFAVASFGQVPAPAAAPGAASASVPGQVQNTVSWSDHYRRATISFGRIVTDGPRSLFAVLGAGVIVTPDGRTAYIVTAKHVFDDPSQAWHPSELHIRFSWQENESAEAEHGMTIRLTDTQGKNLWRTCDDACDLAAIQLPEDVIVKASVMGGKPVDAVGLQDFASTNDLYDGASIFVFGFPGIVGNDRLVRAITRGGTVAWTDPKGVDKPFLVDANIMPGNSGGPVFKVPTGLAKSGVFEVGGRVAFLGIVSQNFGQFYNVTADGRIVLAKFADLPLPSVAQVNVNGIGGMGVVEPSERVRRLVVGMSERAKTH